MQFCLLTKRLSYQDKVVAMAIYEIFNNNFKRENTSKFHSYKNHSIYYKYFIIIYNIDKKIYDILNI